MKTNIVKLINELDILYQSNPATLEEIKKAENILGLKFADEYIQYVLAYGVVACEGIEFTGITDVEEVSVIDVTLKEREYNDCVPHNMYVVENTYMDGMIIWQDEKGMIYITMPQEKPEKVANSLVEYIEIIISGKTEDSSLS